jgi:hypothetical protein
VCLIHVHHPDTTTPRPAGRDVQLLMQTYGLTALVDDSEG